MEFVELINHGSRGRPRVWKIAVEGDTVFIEHGVLGGQLVQTSDVPGPKHKRGSKAHITAEEQALLVMKRKIDKQRRRGYISAGETPVTELVWGGPQPSCLTFSKPVNNMSFEDMRARLDHAPGLWTVKRNGFCHVVTRWYGDIWIQTRDTMAVVNDKYPHLVEELYDVIPHHSIFLMEIFMGAGQTNNDRLLMLEVGNPNTSVEHVLARQEEHGKARGYIYRTPYWDGAHVEYAMPVEGWLSHLSELQYQQAPHIWVIEYFRAALSEAVDWLRQHPEEEGLVCYVPGTALGDDSYNFKGREDRPKICWKLKQAQALQGTAGEDDFIAFWAPGGDMYGHCPNACPTIGRLHATQICPVCGNQKLIPDGSWGTGRYQQQVGGLSLFQGDGKGNIVYIGEVASGLKAADKKRLSDSSLYPITVQVSYQDRAYRGKGDKTNALTHPVFEGVREDKQPQECVSSDLVAR